MSQPPNAARDAAGFVAPPDPLGGPVARAVFEAASEGMLILTPQGLVLAMNASFELLYEIDRSEAVGQHYSVFVRNIEIRRLDATVDQESWVTLRALRGERVEGVVQTVRNCETGREFTARCAATPYFEDGKFVLTTITVEDVTEWMQSRQRLEAALSAAELGVWWIDLVNERVWGDKNFARIYGLTSEEANGGLLSRAYDLIHPDDRERVTEVLRGAALSGESHEVEFRVVGEDGSFRWLLSRGKAEKDQNGTPVRRTGSAIDITQQKNAEASLRRTGEIFEYLVRNSPLGLYVIDEDFRFALASQGAEKVFESIQPLIGRSMKEVVRLVWEEPFASEVIRRFSHTLATGEPYHAPRTMERRADTEELESYDWNIERVNMPDGRPGVVCHFYDLSVHQRHEADLERRVRERTEELTRANEELNSFASSVAHDLRAPLRTIALTSQMLTEGDGGRFTDEERALLGRQSRSAVRLGGIIDDLLRFARLANAEFRSIPFDFSRTARAAAVEVTSRGWAKPPSVEVQAGLRAQGDPNLVGYALTNLLDNAMKFSPEGGQVVVGQHDGAFFVRDEGVGFDMAYAGKLFLAFERLVDQKTFEGTGLGLANVRRIVERHGGRVWAESEPGERLYLLVHPFIATNLNPPYTEDIVFALVLQTALPTQQPATIEMVEYQRVKNALPNGAPDLAAAENFYIRATSTFYLLFDTDTLPVEPSGNRHVHVDRLEYKTFQVFSQTGRPSRKLAEKFTEVLPLWTGKKPMVTGSGSFSGFDLDIPQAQRRVDYLVRTVVEKVETHSEGKRRTTRTSRERHWSIVGGGVNGHKPVLPPMDSFVVFEAGPHVRVDPIKYGYEAVALPKPDDL